MTQAAKIPPLALHRPTPRAPEAVCLGGRFYSSVLWTVPQNSAKMEKKESNGLWRRSVSAYWFFLSSGGKYGGGGGWSCNKDDKGTSVHG